MRPRLIASYTTHLSHTPPFPAVLSFYDQLGYYGLFNETAFTWEPEDIYVTDLGGFMPANMEEGYDKTATIQMGTITTPDALYFRDVFMPGELTKRCIHHQPPSFKELQQLYEENYGRCDN